MRLGGRLQAAIEILSSLDERPRPSAMGLKDWAQSHRFAGSGDRNAIGTLVHDALRNRASNGWLLGGYNPRAAVLGAAIAQWGLSPSELADALAGDPHSPGALSDDETAVLAERIGQHAPDAMRANCPDWLQVRFAQAFGDAWIEELAGLATRPPLDLRANRLKGERAKLLETLTRQGAKPCAIAPDGIRIAPETADARLPNVTAEPAFARGLFEVQDQGSQIAAALCGAEPGMQVLDYCAGAGGKTLAMAAAMGNKGQIFAHDGDSRRLSPLVERMKRAGARNIQLVDRPDRLTALEARMDRVVVDAPCTGTGTWRRRPDIKWRLTPDLVAQRMKDQDIVLREASRFVKPGGVMTYITCSLLPEENGERVAAFLAANPGFVALDGQDEWRKNFGSAPGETVLADGKGLTLTPRRTGTDGFFIALMQRTG